VLYRTALAAAAADCCSMKKKINKIRKRKAITCCSISRGIRNVAEDTHAYFEFVALFSRGWGQDIRGFLRHLFADAGVTDIYTLVNNVTLIFEAAKRFFGTSELQKSSLF
jgi:hypothetical protein